MLYVDQEKQLELFPLIDRSDLYRLWTIEGYSLRTIARRLHVSLSTVRRALHTARVTEGVERFPNRKTPIRPASDRGQKRIKPGESTLPKLGSLQ